MNVLDEARRYLDLRAGGAGWTDDSVDPVDMLGQVLDAFDMECVTQEAHDQAIEELTKEKDQEIEDLKDEHENAQREAKARALNGATVAELMAALQIAIVRERREAADRVESQYLQARADEARRERERKDAKRQQRRQARIDRAGKGTP